MVRAITRPPEPVFGYRPDAIKFDGTEDDEDRFLEQFILGRQRRFTYYTSYGNGLVATTTIYIEFRRALTLVAKRYHAMVEMPTERYAVPPRRDVPLYELYGVGCWAKDLMLQYGVLQSEQDATRQQLQLDIVTAAACRDVSALNELHRRTEQAIAQSKPRVITYYD